MEDARRPVPGVDYPRTFQEMDDWFHSEAGCRDYVRRLRWPDGFVCRRCGVVGEPWVTARGVLHCRACGGETSLTAGTIFEGTRKPLRLWFLAMWFVTSQKNGVSALGLQRVLGLGSYETAWTWLHKLRRAMVRPGRDCLAGEVEVDETYVGGPEQGKRGREVDTKAIVVVAAEKRCYGASGGAMAPSSLQPTNGAPHATAQRFEQIPRRSRTGYHIDHSDRDEPVELARRRYRPGDRTPASKEAHSRPGRATGSSASLAEGSRPSWTHHQAHHCCLRGWPRWLLAGPLATGARHRSLYHPSHERGGVS